MLDRVFRLTEHGVTVRTELFAGFTTFLTMAYIVFLQPAILSGQTLDTETGIDFGAAMVATCLAAALATAIMGLYARYPIALAPGMGQNFFFVITIIPAAARAGSHSPWQAALGVVFVSGVLFLLLSLTPLRRRIVEAIDEDLKCAIAAGIGLFIAFIGLRNAGVILADPGTFVKLNPSFGSPDLWVFAAGLAVAAGLEVRRVPGAILWGILCAAGTAIILRLVVDHLGENYFQSSVVRDSMLLQRFAVTSAVVDLPPSIAPTFLKMDIPAALSLPMIPFVVVLLFMDVFDTSGTLIGVGQRANLLRNGKLERGQRAMLADAVGTVAGSALGTSTVTSYIESAAGVEHGGRTGLTALTVAAFFVVALFFSPAIAMIGSYPPITNPALVIVGSLMMRSIARIEWSRSVNAVPAFLIIVGIPLSFSIADGIALGLIASPIVHLIAGRARDLKPTMVALAIVLVAYFVFVRSPIG